ncbi:glucose-1-phosphate thymidylyltransferase [Actinomadura nitritigenes]|uniref:glucose-1-phosphate thymidylyltransferase n=1 Tax=Actinomadura nitritigenes TaxID=134602 RepID=UPI003D8A5F2A
MKALVLAGGSGTRLRPFSHSTPKQLIPIANRPVLEYVLANLRAIGVREAGVVIGEHGDQITAALGDGSRFGLRLTYIPQDRPRGLAHGVAIARPFLGGGDFVLHLGDVMLPGGIAGAAADFRAARPAAQIAVHRVPDPRGYGVVELARDGTVLRLAEKPGSPRGDQVITGVYFFTAAVHEAVAAVRPSARGELEITDAIQRLLSAGAPVRATRHRGFVRDTGRVDDVLECNRWVLDRLRTAVEGEVDDRSVLAGPVVVEPGARVLASRITGPAIIGAGTCVRGCHIGPHTSLGRGCVLRDSRLEYSIVLDGATVSGVGGIHGSVIGRSAHVGTVAARRRRLVIGDHCRVEVDRPAEPAV